MNSMRIALIHALKHSIVPIEASFESALAGRNSDESCSTTACRRTWRVMVALPKR